MFCRFCGNKLEDEVKVCPHCGESVEEGKKRAARKVISKKVLTIVGASVAAVAVVALIALGIASFFKPNDVQYKDSYSATADSVKDTADVVVTTMGENKLTNSQLQIFYWYAVTNFLNENSSYLSYYGLDYTKPLDGQIYDEKEGLTWQQYFLEEAVNTWQSYQVLYNEAQKAGYQPPEAYEEYFEELKPYMEEVAEKNKFESVDKVIEADFGPGVTYADYEYYWRLYYMGNFYFSELTNKIEVSQDEIDKAFTENEETFKSQGITKESGNLVDVRHILIQPEGGTKSEDGKTTVFSDAEWEACRVKAQEILDKWLAGEKTEDSFAALASEHSTDPGSKSNGGLYRNVYTGQMVQTFNDWCFDETRKEGDYGLVKTSYGYHIMYFITSEVGWVRYSRSAVLSEKSTDLLADMLKESPVQTDYKLISLGVAPLAAAK